MGTHRDAPAPSDRHARAPRGKTCLSCSWLHSLKNWSLLKSRGGSAWLAIQRIRKLPDAWSPVGGRIRRCQLRRFPYGIVYEPTASEIVIIAVAHLHRRPEYWRSRTEQI